MTAQRSRSRFFISQVGLGKPMRWGIPYAQKDAKMASSTDLVVAMDFPSAHEAETLRGKLKGLSLVYKIGLELFVSEGPSLVRKWVKEGERVFLDLKLHDIPNTVRSTLSKIDALG